RDDGLASHGRLPRGGTRRARTAGAAVGALVALGTGLARVVVGLADLCDRLIGAQHLRAQHRLGQAQLPVQLLRGLARRGQADDGVDALGVLVDLVRQPATAPDVDVVDRATVVAD